MFKKITTCIAALAVASVGLVGITSPASATPALAGYLPHDTPPSVYHCPTARDANLLTDYVYSSQAEEPHSYTVGGWASMTAQVSEHQQTLNSRITTYMQRRPNNCYHIGTADIGTLVKGKSFLVWTTVGYLEGQEDWPMRVNAYGPNQPNTSTVSTVVNNQVGQWPLYHSNDAVQDETTRFGTAKISTAVATIESGNSAYYGVPYFNVHPYVAFEQKYDNDWGTLNSLTQRFVFLNPVQYKLPETIWKIYAPKQVQKLRLKKSRKSVKVSWKRSKYVQRKHYTTGKTTFTSSKPTGYRYRITNNKGKKFGSWRKTSATSAVLKTRKPGSYRIQVRAYNRAGNGPIVAKKFVR